MNETNSIKTITQGAGMGGGVATLVSAQDDIIKLIGLVIAVVSLGWSIYERFSRKGGGTSAGLFLAFCGFAALGLLTGCATANPPKGDFFVQVGTNDQGQTVFVPSDTVDSIVRASETISEQQGATPWGLGLGAAGALLSLGVGIYARTLNGRLAKVETPPK